MGFDEIVTSVLLLIAAYTFLWPRAQRSAVPARRHAQRAQRRAQRGLRTSVQPVTSYGALAYVITAYCAVAVAIARDVARSCAGAWRDVLGSTQPPIKPVTQLPSPSKQVSSIRKLTLDDDFADSRAKVAAWNYVAPKGGEVQEKADLGVVRAPEPPVKLVRNFEPVREAVPEPPRKGLTDARRKAIARAVEQGISANLICDLVGGTRAEVLAYVRNCKGVATPEK